jgi:hypothetical protein
MKRRGEASICTRFEPTRAVRVNAAHRIFQPVGMVMIVSPGLAMGLGAS